LRELDPRIKGELKRLPPRAVALASESAQELPFVVVELWEAALPWAEHFINEIGIPLTSRSKVALISLLQRAAFLRRAQRKGEMPRVTSSKVSMT